MGTIIPLLVLMAAASTIRTSTIRVATVSGSPQPPQGVYVATNGSDGNSGTYSLPLATLEAAREAVKTSPVKTVWLRGGTYTRTNTFLLDGDDAGTVYRNYSGESVVLTGGISITNFVTITDPTTLARTVDDSAILVADLAGYSISDYGDLTNRGGANTRHDIRSGYMRPWMVELFSSNVRQQLSRWPNQDISDEVWAWTTTPVPAAPKEAATANWFTYRESNPDNWAFTEDVWLHGGWTYRWADSYEKVISREANVNTFHTDRPGDYGFIANAPYEALNVLEELDQAGEWVIDRAGNKLYFWPPTNAPNTTTTLSVLTNDFVIITNTSSIQLIGLTFQQSRSSGVSLRNSSSNLIAGCLFKNLGNLGVMIGNAIYTNTSDEISVAHNYEGGTANVVQGCEFAELGEGGVAVAGGSRETLTASSHVVTNNYFHGFSRNIMGYRPAVKIDGVGVTVSHAVMRDSKHQAIWFSGNDHVVEYCNIYDVCRDTEDAGAIYAVTRDWKQQGTILRYNFIQPIHEHGIYLDDFTSGVTAYGNIIMCVLYPWLVGGGRDNYLRNNIVVGYNSVGWHVNNRGNSASRTNYVATTLAATIEDVDYANLPYSKYPGMAALKTDLDAFAATPNDTTLLELGYAQGNDIQTNIFLRANPYNYDIDTNRVTQSVNYYNALFSNFSGFTTATTNAVRVRDFELDSGSAAIAAGFQQIPQDSIGVSVDAYGLINPSGIAAYPPVVARGQFKSLTIPGTIQIEDFDNGSIWDAYYNADANNVWNNAWGDGRYRKEAEFYIWGSLSNGARVYQMDLPRDCWVEYTLTATTSKTYTVTVAFTSIPNSLALALDGTTITTGITEASPSVSFAISSGSHVIRITGMGSSTSRLDYLTFE